LARFKLFRRFPRPSLGELLGISQAERQISRKRRCASSATRCRRSRTPSERPGDRPAPPARPYNSRPYNSPGCCAACFAKGQRHRAPVGWDGLSAQPRCWRQHWRPPSRPRPRGSSRVSVPTACWSAWTAAAAVTGCPASAPSRCSSPLPARPPSAARSASSRATPDDPRQAPGPYARTATPAATGQSGAGVSRSRGACACPGARPPRYARQWRTRRSVAHQRASRRIVPGHDMTSHATCASLSL